MARHGLSDDQWELIADVFPPTGHPHRDRRQIVEGILWILRAGSRPTLAARRCASVSFITDGILRRSGRVLLIGCWMIRFQQAALS